MTRYVLFRRRKDGAWAAVATFATRVEAVAVMQGDPLHEFKVEAETVREQHDDDCPAHDGGECDCVPIVG